jgi:hypothetical protein
VQQTLEVLLELDEDAEVGDLGDGAADDHAGLVVLGDGVEPGVLGELLEAQGDPLLLAVHVDNDALDLVALLEQLVGVGDLLGPGDIGDVEEAVDAGLDLDERAVVGEVADGALDDRAVRVLR